MFSTSVPPAPSLPKHSTQPNLLPCELPPALETIAAILVLPSLILVLPCELPPALETIPPLRTEACVRLIEISHAVMVSP